MNLRKATLLFEFMRALNQNYSHCFRDAMRPDQISLDQIETIFQKGLRAGLRQFVLLDENIHNSCIN
jgi:hypothetical protein